MTPQPEQPDTKPGNWQRPFFRGIYSEQDGTPSFSRTGSEQLIIGALAFLFLLGWVIYKGSDAKAALIVPALPYIIGALGVLIGVPYGLNQWGKPKQEKPPDEKVP